MINLTSPRYVMPFHGDFRRMRLHRELAETVGVPRENGFLAANGVPLELTSKGARLGEREQAGMIFVDGMEVGDVEDIALRDRRMLSADGIFIVVATVSEQDGRSVAPPELIFRGVPFLDGAGDDLLDELRMAVDESLARSAKEQISEIDLLQGHLHDDIARFVYERLKRRPMVLPVVVEV
jgi:ribonuclease J